MLGSIANAGDSSNGLVTVSSGLGIGNAPHFGVARVALEVEVQQSNTWKDSDSRTALTMC